MNKKQLGGALMAVLITLGVLGAGIAVVASILFSANNTANDFDKKVKYEHANNKNVLSQGQQKILELAQVPEMARDDILKVTEAAITGRYGADGSKAVFQALTEANPTVDPGLYKALQQEIKAYRDKFEAAQTKLLDVKRSYETALDSMPQGFVMKMLGFPKVPLDTYNIVTTDRTERAFETGREDTPLQLRPAATK